VDYFEAGHGTIAGKKEVFERNVSNHQLSNVQLIEGNSLDVVPRLQQKFGIAFVDANHAYDYVLADAYNCWNLLAPGGFVAFHDYECVEETTRAVNEFSRATGAAMVEAVSGIAVLAKNVGKEVDGPDENGWRLQSELKEAQLRLRTLESSDIELKSLRSQFDAMSARNQSIEATLNAIETSKGWRALNYYRRLRDFALRRRSD
jgi:hypothetical protein